MPGPRKAARDRWPTMAARFNDGAEHVRRRRMGATDPQCEAADPRAVGRIEAPRASAAEPGDTCGARPAGCPAPPPCAALRADATATGHLHVSRGPFRPM